MTIQQAHKALKEAKKQEEEAWSKVKQAQELEKQETKNWLPCNKKVKQLEAFIELNEEAENVNP